MKAPGILRRRAPFLTPFWVAGLAAMLLLLVVYLAGRATIAFAAETTTVIVLRQDRKSVV